VLKRRWFRPALDFINQGQDEQVAGIFDPRFESAERRGIELLQTGKHLGSSHHLTSGRHPWQTC